MSGDAGGLIAALVFAPVLLAGAAAVGIAYGAIKLGGALVSSAVDYGKKKKAEKDLVVNHCSAELEGLYSRMHAVSVQQADAFRNMSVQTQKKLDAAAAQIQRSADAVSAENFAMLNQTIQQTHRQVDQIMAGHAKQVHDTILAPAAKQLTECAREIDAAAQTKADLVNWKEQTQAARAQQKAVAYDALRDAIASVNMMDKLSASWQDRMFRQQYETLKGACDLAQSYFDQGLYESASADSRKVIRQVAMAVAAQQAKQMERDFAAMQLQAKISGLMEEMESRRYLHIPAAEGHDEELDEDLDEYSQGAYSRTQELLLEKLEAARNCANNYEIQQLTAEFDNELQPKALKVIEVAQQVMQGYHEKLKVLDVVAEFMEQQNYTMDWAAPVGDDLSQKLVVKFVNNVSGSSVSVTLDNRAETGDIAKMAMEVLTFYRDGNEVTEQEKKRLRDDLNRALQKAGVMGSMQCSGQVNLPSSKPEMNSEEGVLNEPVRRIIE